MLNRTALIALIAVFASSFAVGCAADDASTEPAPVADEAKPAPAAPTTEKPATSSGTEKPVEEAPSGSPTVLGKGSFIDKNYKGSGTALLLMPTDGGAPYLRLEDFSTSSGPALHVLLTKEANPSSAADVDKGKLDLGPLRAISGNLTYPLPAGTDPSAYAGVIVYCVEYSMIFTAAPLR